MMEPGVIVRGLPELKRTAKAAGKQASRELNAELRKVAEPIRSDAESLAASGIPRIGPKWSRMRIGVTTKLVYVAPKQKGVKARGADPRRRPKFAPLLDARAMTPALNQNKENIEGRVEDMFESLAREWNGI